MRRWRTRLVASRSWCGRRISGGRRGAVAGSTDVPLVGRSEELGRVLAALRRAAAGSGGALLLAGEAGIGKSRLAVEALALARQRGFQTLEGAAYPLQADLAYAPVLEALRPCLAGLEPGRLAALVSGLPDLGRLFAGLHLPPPEPLGDASLERTRLFEAVSRLVERVAAERPVALLVDDLHWADAASLELLHYLARGLGVRRVLLLGTYRLDEARTHPGLRELVRSLQRLGLAEELPVGGLSPEAVAALARGLLGGEPPAALLGALRERAAGMPLFVTALIRGLRDTGGLFRSGGAWVLGSGTLTAVPPVVRDLVLARLERLDPADRALLELVAVASDAASAAVLGRVGGPGAQELDEGLRRLCESGLVIEEPAGSDFVYRAAHPLIAEVAYGELPEGRRRRLHAGVAAAREHGLQALAVAERARLSAPTALTHRHLGMTAANVGDHRLAREHLVADLELVRQTGSPTLELGARFLMLAIDLVTDAWEEALRAAEELLALGYRVGYARGVATGLAGRAFVLAHRGRPEEATRCVAEAREIYGAAAAADRHIFTVVEIAEATVALAAGDPERARVLAAAAAATPAVLPCLGLSVLGEAQVAAGDPTSALDTARRLGGLGPDAPWPAACASWVEGLARVALGERVAALACLRRAAARLDGLGLPFQAARARLGWAEVAAAGRADDEHVPAGRADAVEAARSSLTTFDRLGARPCADRARRLLRALGERPAAPPKVGTGELSERELQVVRLVAAGLSNTEIAGRLFISPRTVTTHLQHVYGRLGLPSRTALTRWVLERGLAAEDT